MNNLWKKWTINCALGELIGIGCAGAIAFLVNSFLGEPTTFSSKLIVLVVMMFAGFIEGLVLSLFQWKVLKTKFQNLPKWEWTKYTVLVGVLGWFLGMLPSLFFMPEMSTSENSTSIGFDYSNPWIFALLSIIMGLLLGAIFGLFQWFSLRKHAQKAHLWIVANALGWGLGLEWIYLFASIPNENSSVAFIIFVGVLGGILAGLSVGAITGFYLIKFKEKDPSFE